MFGSLHQNAGPRPALSIPAIISLLGLIRFEAETDEVLGDFAAIIGVAIDHLADLRSVAQSAIHEADDASIGSVQDGFQELDDLALQSRPPRRLC